MLSILRTSRRPRAARAVFALATLAAVAAACWWLLPLAHAGVSTWPGGVITYRDQTGMPRTVDKAAERWNASGAHVEFRRAAPGATADVVVRVNDRLLRQRCGGDCLGFSSSIGRPTDGHSQVLLASDLGGNPRPLSVWVAAHEFGHVLGLRHRTGHACSLMSEHAFDTRCSPSLQATEPTPEELACVPAPTDVDAAARMYGGHAYFKDPRCR